LRARADIVDSMAKRLFDQAFNGNWTKYLGPVMMTFPVVEVPQTLQGTGTGDTVTCSWSGVLWEQGTGTGNTQVTVVSGCPDSQDLTPQQSNIHADVAVTM